MEKKTYSQINFDFSDPSSNREEPAVGVRIKALKTAGPDPVEPTGPEEQETPVKHAAAARNEGVKKSTRGRKSLKALDAAADLVNIPDDATLFQRQYYSIGEVATMFGVNQSLLRFWEN